MADLFQCTCPHCGRPMPDQNDNAQFNQFWALCPVKIGKQPACKAWNKLTGAQQLAASDNVKAWYVWFRKEYPTASPLHPSTYLNQRRWEDEGWTRPRSPADPFQSAADAIQSGHKWRCTSIGASTARGLIEQGRVTHQQCREVGVL